MAPYTAGRCLQHGAPPCGARLHRKQKFRNARCPAPCGGTGAQRLEVSPAPVGRMGKSHHLRLFPRGQKQCQKRGGCILRAGRVLRPRQIKAWQRAVKVQLVGQPCPVLQRFGCAGGLLQRAHLFRLTRRQHGSFEYVQTHPPFPPSPKGRQIKKRPPRKVSSRRALHSALFGLLRLGGGTYRSFLPLWRSVERTVFTSVILLASCSSVWRSMFSQ